MLATGEMVGRVPVTLAEDARSGFFALALEGGYGPKHGHVSLVPGAEQPQGGSCYNGKFVAVGFVTPTAARDRAECPAGEQREEKVGGTSYELGPRKVAVVLHDGIGPDCAFRRHWDLDGTFLCRVGTVEAVFLTVNADGKLDVTRDQNQAISFTDNPLPTQTYICIYTRVLMSYRASETTYIYIIYCQCATIIFIATS